LEKDWARSGSTPIHITRLHLHLELSTEEKLPIIRDGENFVTRKFAPDSISALRHLAEDHVRIGLPKEIRIDFRIVGATDAAIFTLKSISRMAGQTMWKALCDRVEILIGNATSKHTVVTV
jgi:hypothetical protein